MFTGIVEELGAVVAVEDQGDAARMTFRGPLVVSDARRGDSIAVNGVCLTVIDPGPDSLDRKSTRLNSSHSQQSRMPSSA